MRTTAPAAAAVSGFRVGAGHPAVVAAAAGLLFLANAAHSYPGTGNFDASLQYAEALSGHLTDWQPPVMAWLWSWLAAIKPGKGPLFLIHVGCYWLGFGLVAAALARLGHRRSAWAILAIAVAPPLLLLNAEIIKDVGMAVTLLACFGILFWFRAQGMAVPALPLGAALLLLLYGTLVRWNAVFALPPLLIYLAGGWTARPVRPLPFLLLCAGVCLAAIPVVETVNHRLLRAAPTHPIRQLQTFDVAGIAVLTGDVGVFRDPAIRLAEVSACYSPVIRDTLDPVTRDFIGDRASCRIALDPAVADPTWTWARAIARHPLAYLHHRLRHFAHELSAILPVHHAADRKYDRLFYVVVTPSTPREWLLDIVRMCAVFIPWFSFILGLVVVLLCARPGAPQPSDPAGVHLNDAAFLLAASGLFYMAAYIVVGVASDFRYQYWGMIAIPCAAVIGLAARRRDIASPSAAAKASVGVLVASLLVIQTAQIVHRLTLPTGVDIDERTGQRLTPPTSPSDSDG